MLRDFIAIDFETANQQPSSVCSVGVVMVRDGQIVDSFYSLIQPEPNYYNYWCQRVHGISESDTNDAPMFSRVWQQLEERIADVYFSNQENDDIRYQIASPDLRSTSDATRQRTSELASALAASSVPFVAHNARFDEGCLKAVFKVYQMDYPDYRFYDTLTASRRQFGHSFVMQFESVHMTGKESVGWRRSSPARFGIVCALFTVRCCHLFPATPILNADVA